MTSPRQRGISLTELMVALAIGLILLLTLGYLFSGSLHVFRQQDEGARLQESSRFLMDALGRQITQAGYAAISTSYTDTKMEFTGAPIGGEHGVVAVRVGERKAGSDYLSLSFDGASDCHGNPVAGVVVNEFYLNNDDEMVCASGGAVETLAEGVEAFRLSYGVDADGDAAVERYQDTPADWGQVRSVRVCFVLRTLTAGTANPGQRYRDCDDVDQTAPDTRLRRLSSATYQLRNR